MHLGYAIAHFFAGAFLANTVPHYVAGVMGEPFQSPFAKPPGKGLSSSTINILWAFFNLACGYLLLMRVGDFDLRAAADVLPAATGAFLMSLMLAKTFGKLHGGNAPV